MTSNGRDSHGPLARIWDVLETNKGGLFAIGAVVFGLVVSRFAAPLIANALSAKPADTTTTFTRIREESTVSTNPNGLRRQTVTIANELWTSTIAESCYVGEQSVLKLTCEISIMTFEFNERPEDRTFTLAREPTTDRPERIPDGYTVTADSDAEWLGESSRTTPEMSNNPLTWIWTFKPKQTGKQVVLLTLPQINHRTSGIGRYVNSEPVDHQFAEVGMDVRERALAKLLRIGGYIVSFVGVVLSYPAVKIWMQRNEQNKRRKRGTPPDVMPG